MRVFVLCKNRKQENNFSKISTFKQHIFILSVILFYRLELLYLPLSYSLMQTDNNGLIGN